MSICAHTPFFVRLHACTRAHVCTCVRAHAHSFVHICMRINARAHAYTKGAIDVACIGWLFFSLHPELLVINDPLSADNLSRLSIHSCEICGSKSGGSTSSDHSPVKRQEDLSTRAENRSDRKKTTKNANYLNWHGELVENNATITRWREW